MSGGSLRCSGCALIVIPSEWTDLIEPTTVTVNSPSPTFYFDLTQWIDLSVYCFSDCLFYDLIHFTFHFFPVILLIELVLSKLNAKNGWWATGLWLSRITCTVTGFKFMSCQAENIHPFDWTKQRTEIITVRYLNNLLDFVIHSPVTRLLLVSCSDEVLRGLLYMTCNDSTWLIPL